MNVRLKLEGKCTLWKCKSTPPYYVVSVDKYWHCKGSLSWVRQKYAGYSGPCSAANPRSFEPKINI